MKSAGLFWLGIGLGILGAGRCRGDVTLPALISDNMVLQAEMKTNVWGKADPGESVTVQLGEASAQATAGKDGTWGVKLSGLPPGGPYDLTISGKNSITVRNVAVGEVWVCAGESNMEYKVIAARNGRDELADAELPMVRVFEMKQRAAEKPEPDCEGAWVECNAGTARDFSAIGFFFARELNRRLREPIGIIESAWGPSPIEAWMPSAVLQKGPGSVALERYAKAVSDYPSAMAAYQARLAAWQAGGGNGSNGTAGVPKPVAPLAPGGTREPSALYNGMIYPLRRYPIRGVLWYQGESNTGEPGLYRKLFPPMIETWRADWDEGEFPFFYAQLAGFLGRHPQPEESQWAELREAQAQALEVPRTGMAVTADTGGEHEMHPADKQDVAHRLALMAQSDVYGKGGISAAGPVFSGMEVEDGKAVIAFKHAEGLKAKEAKDGQAVKGFEIAGEDRKFVWADARIDGGEVIVESKEVPKPVAVRYGWADFPECSLVNSGGMPAAPFRTDNWVAGVAGAEASPSATPGRHRRRRGGDE